MSSEITKRIKRELREMAESFFEGIAIPSLVAVADEQMIEDEQYVFGTGLFDTIKGQRYAVCEKLLKFAGRRRKKRVSRFKHDKKYNPACDDLMIVVVGKPGSKERIDALCEQYAAIGASGHEVSPFRN
jgi:hypothetical protein